MDKVTINACVADTRISFGDWYVPNGKTPQECTYCEWCIKNGCVSMDDIYKFTENVYGCNCDCPNKKTHECIREYVCEKHHRERGEEMVLSCPAMRQCKTCTQFGRSWSEIYCNGCSAVFQICKYCGEK